MQLMYQKITNKFLLFLLESGTQESPGKLHLISIYIHV